jgi:hypothetical protein
MTEDATCAMELPAPTMGKNSDRPLPYVPPTDEAIRFGRHGPLAPPSSVGDAAPHVDSNLRREGRGGPRCHLPWPHAQVVPTVASISGVVRGREGGGARVSAALVALERERRRGPRPSSFFYSRYGLTSTTTTIGMDGGAG